MKQSIRLTESDIKRIVRESVNRILREEWESPLDKAKKKRNDFDNVKKIDLSKFEKKPKKPKAGTFGDLPSFAKLKNRNDESYNRYSISRALKEDIDYESPIIKSRVDRVNQIFDACEKHRKNWTPVLNHLDPFAIIISKYYSDWISAVRRDYSARHRLFSNLNTDIFFGVDAYGYEIIKKIFEERYGE